MFKRFSYLAFIFSTLLLLASQTGYAGGVDAFTEPKDDEFLHPDKAFQLDVAAIDSISLEGIFKVAPGYYLYKDRIKFEIKDTNQGKVTNVDLPTGDMKDDPNFGNKEVYHHDFAARIATENTAENIVLLAKFQGCSEKGLCYAPQTKTYELSIVGGVANAAISNIADNTDAVVNNDDKTTQALKSGNLWLVVSLFFVAGLLLSFTPCVLPMIPILSSIILNSQSKQAKPSKLHAFALSVAYVLGMALTYTLAGVAAGLSGSLLSQSLQNVWVLSATALVFVILALSMFGLYELKLPAAFENKILHVSQKLKGGEFLGVFLMGALSALVVSPCVAAPLAGALIYIGQSRDVFLGGAGLFALAIGMGVPLLLIGASAGSILPKAGSWMSIVRNFFGVLMLAMAAYLVWPVLPNSFTAPVNKILGFSVENKLPFSGVKSVTELDAAIQGASGKTIMLDFYADWCVSCKEMEKFTFSKPEVHTALKNIVLLKADVTENNADDQALLKRFNLFGPPGIIFFDQSGKELPIRVIGYENSEKFLSSINRAKASQN